MTTNREGMGTRCDWLEDITYMKRPEFPWQRTVMPCPNIAEYVQYGSEIVVKGLCKSHYDDKVYRGEDVTGYEKFDAAKFYGLGNPSQKTEGIA